MARLRAAVMIVSYVTRLMLLLPELSANEVCFDSLFDLIVIVVLT